MVPPFRPFDTRRQRWDKEGVFVTGFPGLTPLPEETHGAHLTRSFIAGSLLVRPDGYGPEWKAELGRDGAAVREGSSSVQSSSRRGLAQASYPRSA